MSSPKTDGGWRLPAVIDPPTRIGVCVPVPDEPEHRRAFLGALLALARWWNWQRDSARRGREAAAVWFQIWRQVQAALDDREGCNMSSFDVRQSTSDPCQLEKTADGSTWSPWADVSLCRPDLPALTAGGDIYVPFNGDLIPIGDLPPDTDEITTSNQRRPAGDDPEAAKCIAAMNAAYVFRRLHEEAWKFAPFTQTPANEIIAGVLVLVLHALVAPPAIPLIAAGALIAYFFVANANQMTGEVEREFACILKNRAYIADGEVRFDFALVRQDAAAKIVGINVWSFIVGYLDIIGANGLNLAGTTNAIDACCNPCDNSAQVFIIDLKLPQNQNTLAPVNAFSSTWTWINGTGWRLQGVGATGQGTIRFTSAIRRGCIIDNILFRFTVSHEPYDWTIITNGIVRSQEGYSAFGNFYHGYAASLNIAPANINALLGLHVRAAVNSSATFDELRIVYRGCPPL